MPVTDPVADMLTRIRNATAVRHESLGVPSSRMKVALATILQAEGFITRYEVVPTGVHPTLRLHLRYHNGSESAIKGLRRVSKPGLRVYVKGREIPRFHGSLGVSILSTPQGLMTGREAWRRGIGGELLCYIW